MYFQYYIIYKKQNRLYCSKVGCEFEEYVRGYVTGLEKTEGKEEIF